MIIIAVELYETLETKTRDLLYNFLGVVRAPPYLATHITVLCSGSEISTYGYASSLGHNRRYKM